MKKAVKVFAIIATLGFVVNLILSIIWLSNEVIDGGLFFILIFSNLVTLVLLWALHSALARIEKLESEVTYCKKEIRKTIESQKETTQK